MAFHHRLFYAFLPPLPQRQAISGVRNACAPSDAIVSDDRLHSTIAITGDYPNMPSVIADHMAAAAAQVTGAPVPIVLDRLSLSGHSIALRPHRRPQGWSTIHAQLWRALVAIGAAREGWHSNPHVTLGYDRRDAGERTVAPIAWLAREFVLIHSIVGATRHVVLGRWPLIDSQLGFDF